MALKITARHGGAVAAGLDDITDRVPFLDGVPGTPIVQMGMSVQNGGASQGTMLVPDPTANDDASLYFPPHTQVTLTEDATGDELMLAQGRISGFQIGRAPGSEIEDAVEWTLTIDDANVDLRGLAFTEDWVRPVETGLARLAALAAYTLSGTSSTRPDFDSKITYRPSTTITVSSSHLAPATNAVVMPSHTYPAGTQPQDIANDVATTEGKVYGVVPHHSGGSSHLCMLFIKESDHSTYASAASISSELSDWDPDDLTAPVWEPIWDQGKGQRVDGNQNISGLVSRYGSDDKVIVSVDETLGDDNEYWVDAYQDGDSKDPTQAANRAASIIAYRSPFSESDFCSIEIAREQHVLITAGMSIQVKAPPVNAGTLSTVGTYVDRRIVTLQWEPRVNGKLHAVLQLNRPTRVGGIGKGQPASTTPAGAPNCDDETPIGFALGVDGAGWTKNDSANPPDGLGRLIGNEAANVSASGDHAILSNGEEQRFEEEFLPGTFYSYYTGALVTSDYTAAAPEHMLFRFTITQLGNSGQPFWFQNGSSSGAAIYFPFNVGAPMGTEHDGQVGMIGGTPVDFTLLQDQAYFLRVNAGNVKIWEVEDAEPGSWTASGPDTGTGILAFYLKEVTNALYHDADYTPSTVEVESLTLFQLINDPFCLTDPGDSPYFAKSDDPRFDTIVTDHGGLSGLGDDDHTQYIKDAEFTAKGDLLAGTASGTFDNLAVGSNGKVLKANSATSTGLEWATETAGGSGPFEDIDTVNWKFTSPADTLKSTDETSYISWLANELFLVAAGQSLDFIGDKAIFDNGLGLVVPVFSGDPAGGDSEAGQVYYDSGTDKFRAYENGSWVDMIGASGTVPGVTVTTAALGYSGVLATNNSTPAASGAYIHPIQVNAPMLVRSLDVHMQAASSGTWQWGLFDTSASSTAATKLAGGSGTLNGTGIQTIAATSAPVTVPPGGYFLIMHAPAANVGSVYRVTTVSQSFVKSQASYTWDDTPDITTGWGATVNFYQFVLHGDLDGSNQW